MAYDFKNLNEVPVQDEPTENTTIMAFEGGVPKQIPANAINGGSVFVIDTTADDYDTTNVDYGNTIKEAMLRGDTMYVYQYEAYVSVFAFKVVSDTMGGVYLYVYPSAIPDTTGLMLNTGYNKFISFAITL